MPRSEVVAARAVYEAARAEVAGKEREAKARFVAAVRAELEAGATLAEVGGWLGVTRQRVFAIVNGRGER